MAKDQKDYIDRISKEAELEIEKRLANIIQKQMRNFQHDLSKLALQESDKFHKQIIKKLTDNIFKLKSQEGKGAEAVDSTQLLGTTGSQVMSSLATALQQSMSKFL